MIRARFSARRWLSVAVCTASVVLAGCQGGTGQTPRSGGGGARAADVSLGAFDERARRANDQPVEHIFAALDLPTPTEARLGTGEPGDGYWQQRCDYTIDATLDEDSRRLDATMRVTYHNNSPYDLDYFWMQLEQNLFRTDSVGSRSRTPGGVMKTLDGFDGGYEIRSLTHNGRELDRDIADTLMRVELDQPIRAGTRFTFDLAFSFEMPPHLRRMGAEEVEDGVIFEYAQWFPHMCKYDDVHGWNTLPYLGTGEFYTDFGNYDVSLTVPRDHLVGASGELLNPNEVLTPEQMLRYRSAMVSDEPVVIRSVDEVGDGFSRPDGTGPLTWRYRIQNARTFAWASSPAFVWDACSVEITNLNGAPRRVLCQSLYPREAEVWFDTHEDGGSSRFVRHAVEYYSEWLFPYPYPSMINVNGPEGGMEYPGIIFCGARTNVRGLFGVTDHEVGHTWFPMIVNSDERRHVWMDEGFNSFINIYSRADFWGEDADLGRHLGQTLQVGRADNRIAIATAPDHMWSRWVGRLGYRKPALALYLLREVVLGETPEQSRARFDRAFRKYVHDWAFKSPQPADFFRVMEDAAGRDLAWFWRGWFLTSSTLDQAVTRVGMTPEGLAFATFENRLDMVMPVLYRVEYADGTSEDRRVPVEAFQSTDRWRAWWDPQGRRVRSVSIDPDGLMPDEDRSNNSRRR